MQSDLTPAMGIAADEAAERFCVITRKASGWHRQARSDIDAMLSGDLSDHLSSAQFDYLRGLARDHAGIVIADFKRSMLLRRISKRLKVLGLPSVGEYCALLRSPDGEAEIERFINALTTNKTEFFREAHHFSHVRSVALPAIIEEKRTRHSKRIRIWSAGCSSGEEAWSLAMVVHSELGLDNTPPGTFDIKILATDIDTDVLAKAASGRYKATEAQAVPPALRHRYLRPCPGHPDQVEVTPDLRGMVVFKPLNLHAAWPFRGPFDIIFCRNVVIYFDRSSQRILFNRMAGVLGDHGLLYCGHSESLHGISTRFRPIGRSVYERLR